MDTKYNIGNNNTQMNGMNNKNKFQIRVKPTPILFGNKNGLPPSPKRMKLNGKENKATIPNNKPKLSIQEQRKKLPIFDKRNKLIELIQKHKTLIILGETGSGKTTQIPQFIYSAQMHENGKIGVTQPRRVAAISIATRVAAEIGQGTQVGELVGYSVRFQDETSKKTKIKFMTDGMLLREAIFDRQLMEYNVIILDEAHERTIHTDVLFGIVKKAQKLRENRDLPPLKIIIMSATMDVDHFSQYFNNCQAVYIEGRTYPVSLHYTVKPHDDYEAACVATFFKIHKDAPPDHDVLIFLTGQEEIETCANRIRTLSKQPDVIGPPLKIYTLYAAQSHSQQMSIFQPSPANTRKVIISTNIAETSVTISGIKYVIDSGMVKVRTFHPTTGLETLKVQRISQEQAWQRTGRAGRDSEGHCYRLYTRSQFELMRKATIPEIQRANLCTVSLQLLSLGFHSMHFNFMDKPPKESITAASEHLVLLGAVENIASVVLTPIGKKMNKFPIDPHFSKIILSASEFGCLEEALIVVALMSAESILITPQSKREQAQQVRQKFHSAYGDLVTLLNIVREFNSVAQNNRKAWCHEHFINMKNILHVKEIKDQLEEICCKCGLSINSCGGQLDQLRKCLITGLFTNVAELYRDKQYITLDKRNTVQIHPSSVLHGQLPHLVIFTEVVQTNKCYIRGLTTIESKWIQDIVPEYVKSKNIKIS
ncbi:unnamed protein product [Acanthoscelides obtectus]|uniref:RNA helicase n=2 Tax=Acanthoscelides obtectus TaxID=200917 RepID=A0A9P0LXC3_ACAOB|nr:unnamed protein product [Acanthoscelides obtectus]CAK1677250.1 Putative ATP-dependent RNA helicase DHX33 [Acanthoscelides obtectus]